jgi:predicted NUDIX family NTP pyrophosphohydrolase
MPTRAGQEHDLGIFRQPAASACTSGRSRNCNPAGLVSNLLEIEWPPKSGGTGRFPEADRGDWFDRARALLKIAKGQRPILEKFYAAFG